MRSRYVAYNLGDFEYIKNTCDEDARLLFELNDSKEKLNGVRLDVINTFEDSPNATIEFKAYYSKKGMVYYLHEESTFKFKNGRWVYVSGKQLS